jgi:hypothetical protein
MLWRLLLGELQRLTPCNQNMEMLSQSGNATHVWQRDGPISQWRIGLDNRQCKTSPISTVDRETGYVIAQSVDGSRYIVPLDFTPRKKHR